MSTEKVVIVGGVAGGASCAARARRLSEDAEIVVLERGPFVSFANCGLPYHIGGDIKDRSKLVLQTPEKLKTNFNLDVRTLHEVKAIDRGAKCVRVKNLETGEEYEESYEALVLAPGAAPLRPPIPGIEKPGHFTLRTIPDMDAIKSWIEERKASRAVVVGGGYIGLEMAEQLRERGLAVTLVEMLPQVMGPLDPEMAALLHQEMQAHGVELRLGNTVVGFEDPADGQQAAASMVALKSGERLAADVVIMGLGVRPEVWLAKEAGLELDEHGGLKVDEYLRTSDPDIYGVGDAIEVVYHPLGVKYPIPLAGPANRQGRAAADNIFGIPSRFAGVIGTAVLRLFGLTAACTGANGKLLEKMNIPFEAAHLHAAHHVGYYPGAEAIALKLLWSPETGKVLGAQAVGKVGVDKRIDVIATAIKLGATVDDLADLELCYAPPYGAAKDPVNLAGMVAQNVQRGLTKLAQWQEIDDVDPETQLVLDVREAAERERIAIPGSLHIPLGELRERLGEVPQDKEIIVHCASGQRSNNALRILLQRGYRARNLTGSMKTWEAGRSAAR